MFFFFPDWLEQKVHAIWYRDGGRKLNGRNVSIHIYQQEVQIIISYTIQEGKNLNWNKWELFVWFVKQSLTFDENGEEGYLVQKTLCGRATNMGSKISLLV